MGATLKLLLARGCYWNWKKTPDGGGILRFIAEGDVSPTLVGQYGINFLYIWVFKVYKLRSPTFRF